MDAQSFRTHLYERVKDVIPRSSGPFFAPYVKAINAL